MRPRPQHTNWFVGQSIELVMKFSTMFSFMHAFRFCHFFQHVHVHLITTLKSTKKRINPMFFFIIIIIVVLEKNGAQIQIFVIHGRISKPHVLDYFLLLQPLAQMAYMTSIMAPLCHDYSLYSIKNSLLNHLGGDPVVRAWDQEVCSLYGFRFEPCGCSYDGHWRLTWSLTSGPVGLVEVRAS